MHRAPEGPGRHDRSQCRQEHDHDSVDVGRRVAEALSENLDPVRGPPEPTRHDSTSRMRTKIADTSPRPPNSRLAPETRAAAVAAGRS